MHVSGPLGGLWGGAEAKIQLFQNMVMMHIKFQGNGACSNMIANIFPVLTRGGWGQKVMIKFFSTWSCCISKGMTNAATYKHIFWPYTLPRPLGWGQRSKQFFSESSSVAYQNNGNGAQHHASTYSVIKHTLDPLDWVKRSKHFLMKVVMLHIKFKGMD